MYRFEHNDLSFSLPLHSFPKEEKTKRLAEELTVEVLPLRQPSTMRSRKKEMLQFESVEANRRRKENS
jgi:hypothetical protein